MQFQSHHFFLVLFSSFRGISYFIHGAYSKSFPQFLSLYIFNFSLLKPSQVRNYKNYISRSIISLEHARLKTKDKYSHKKNTNKPIVLQRKRATFPSPEKDMKKKMSEEFILHGNEEPYSAWSLTTALSRPGRELIKRWPSLFFFPYFLFIKGGREEGKREIYEGGILKREGSGKERRGRERE